ncbi:MAG TPA: 50S ribosomal protein L6 [candidate division Zixibacteria bacterium]|nr:50S ribosomal protein L6 [candidate division Zixibacteria bacterium]
MSRIGKLPIMLPQGLKVAVEGDRVRIEGPKGRLETTVPEGISVKVEGNVVRVERRGDERKVKALHGLTRKLLANMADGVSKGFTRVLEINGVGYRAEVKGQELHMTLGYSHPVVFPLPPGITASVERQTIITLSGADRQLLGETAAKIRSLRPPEPYKGKGIKYREEVIRRKAGKAVGSAGA